APRFDGGAQPAKQPVQWSHPPRQRRLRGLRRVSLAKKWSYCGGLPRPGALHQLLEERRIVLCAAVVVGADRVQVSPLRQAVLCENIDIPAIELLILQGLAS